MAHRHPPHPYFTREVCRRGILQEPFRLIDVGVRGGIGEHWLHFGDHLHAWGFDPLYEQGVGPLIEANKYPERIHYLNFGIADEDGFRAFKFYGNNPSSSHFVASNGTDAVDETWQSVPIRRLDSLVSDGTIGPIDFMKMDAETYEIEILRGAQQFFATSAIFGVESETHFLRTQRNPRSHFVELYEQLAPYRFSVYDSGAHRVPRSPLVHGFPQEVEDGTYMFRPTGRACIFDFLFLHESFDDGAQQKEIGVDRLIKMIATAETYNLHDVGLDILFANQERLGRRFDVEEAADWLVREHEHSTLTYHQYRTRTIPARHEPPDTDQFTYEGRGRTDTVIPEHPKNVTRHHGASIMRISPRHGAGATELHMRVLLNCHCSEPNSVRVAVFQDDSERPLSVLTEHLIEAELTLIDQDFVASVANTSHPPVFEIRVGLAHCGGTLSLNHVPGQDGGAAFSSAVRLRWLSAEKDIGAAGSASQALKQIGRV